MQVITTVTISLTLSSYPSHRIYLSLLYACYHLHKSNQLALSIRQRFSLSVQPSSHIYPIALKFVSVNTLRQSAVLIKYSNFVRYHGDTLSVSGFPQSAAFISQLPSPVSGLHHSMVFNNQRSSLVSSLHQLVDFISR